MKLLITGAEQGLGKAIVQHPKIKTAFNIKGKDILHLIEYGVLKKHIDNLIDQLDFNPDVVVNNFGINHLSWIGETPAIDYRIMEANVMCGYWIVNALVAHGHVCRVLNISSVAGRIPMRCTTLYCTSKAAIMHMTKVMARELASSGWVVNCFAPGKISDTEMGALTDQQVRILRKWPMDVVDLNQLKAIPLGKYLSLDEAAEIAINILQMSDHVNGETISASGGM